MTELDWSPELWVACHDEDEQNARLARHVWEDNGLDVSEGFLEDMLAFLGASSVHDRFFFGGGTMSMMWICMYRPRKRVREDEFGGWDGRCGRTSSADGRQDDRCAASIVSRKGEAASFFFFFFFSC